MGSMGKRWVRVYGPDIQPEHWDRHEKAVARMKDENFKNACEKAGIEPTRRQARKWNNKKGKAYKMAHNIKMNGIR